MNQSPETSVVKVKSAGEQAFNGLLKSLEHEPWTAGKLLGWMAATFFQEQIQREYFKFPLLHVTGPAGVGKSETVRHLLTMFYGAGAADCAVTPSSSASALQTILTSPGAAPIFVDEYKRSRMPVRSLEMYRQAFRNVYNYDGSGSTNRPVIFAGEEPETEIAILERVVPAAMEKSEDDRARFENFSIFSNRAKRLTFLNKSLGRMAKDKANVEVSFAGVLRMYESSYTVTPEFMRRLGAGEYTTADYEKRCKNRGRAVFNLSVVVFGLQMLEKAIAKRFGNAFTEQFTTMIDVASDGFTED